MTGPLFTAEALQPLRDVHRASLVSRARAEVLTLEASAGGGANTGARRWVTVDGADDVACRLAPVAPAAPGTSADQRTAVGTWELAVDPCEVQLAPGMRVTVAGADPFTSEVWTRAVVIVGARAPRTFSVMRVYVCRDAEPGQLEPGAP